MPYRYPHRYLIDVRSPILISHIDIGSYLVTLVQGPHRGLTLVVWSTVRLDVYEHLLLCTGVCEFYSSHLPIDSTHTPLHLL